MKLDRFRHIFLASEKENQENLGTPRRSLLTQWIAKYGYLPIVLIGMAGLLLEIDSRLGERRHHCGRRSCCGRELSSVGRRRWKTNPSQARAWSWRHSTLILDCLICPIRPHRRDIYVRQLADEWTPVPLPERSASSRSPHATMKHPGRNRAGGRVFDVDVGMMKAFARIESGYNPRAKTGSYKCLFQLSNWEFAKYWQGDIYDIRDCSIAAARKFATEAAEFEKDIGREATAAELYCIHQQGYQGCAFHHAAPQQLAWKNMYLTSEGQEKGEKWARKAIWGNVPSDIKNKIKGGVDALTSGEFLALWTERVNRFMARKVEPPTQYMQPASTAKKLTHFVLAAKKKTKVAATK